MERTMKLAIYVIAVMVILVQVLHIEASFDMDKLDCKPQQVHLAYGDSVLEVVVVWSTRQKCSAQVHYGSGPWDMTNIVEGSTIELPETPKGTPPENKVSYLHKVKLNNLKENTDYYYMAVSSQVMSEAFYFKTPAAELLQPNLMVYGDLGVHSNSLPTLIKEVMKGGFTAVLHVGDFGYNLFDTIKQGQNAGENVGDVFMRQIEPMAAHVPYMVAPGNHEIEEETFNQYRYRFAMPNTDWPIPKTKMWYSLNIGPVHFLSYSSEVFFTDGGQYIESQRAWISADLDAANNNRHAQPWVIAFGHRPMYCSNGDGDDCTKNHSLVRDGLEDLFYNKGVDVILQAHEHSYERLWPMYKGIVLSHNYTNPPAPVQLISGAAGSKYYVDMMSNHTESWSAFKMDRQSFDSYGRLKVFNSTHLYWQQMSVDKREILDSIWIVQNSHGPFTQSTLDTEQKQKIEEQIKKEEVENKNRKPTFPNLKPKPTTTGDSLTEKVTKAIKGADTKVVVGVCVASLVVLILLIVCIVRKCRKRSPRSYRRWETVDYGKKFYTNLKDEKDTDDFEVDVTDGTTKLINGERTE